MMKKIVLCLLLFFCAVSFSQRTVLDSLLQQVKQHPNQDTARAFYLSELAWQYLDYSTDSSGLYAGEALTLSEKLNYVEGIISAKNVKGLLLRIDNKTEEAIRIAEEVVELRKRYGPPERLTGSYSNLGSVYIVKGDNAQAIHYLNKALENAVQFKQTENQILILTNMGIVYGYAELNDLSMEVFQKAVSLNKQLSGEAQKQQEAQLYGNIASLYHKRGLYKEAARYSKQAYDYYKKENNIRELSTIVFNLTSTSRHLMDMKSCEQYINEMESIAAQLEEERYTANFHITKANFLLDMKRYAEAMSEADQGLAIVDTANSIQEYALLLGVKSDVYKHTKDYQRSLEFADKAMAEIRKTDNRSEVVTLYKLKSEVYKAMSDYKMSLLYYEKAILLKDSISTDLFDTRIATLNAFNQLDKKEKELAMSNQEKEKVSLENKRQATMLIAGSLVGLLVIVLLVFSFRAYKIKQKDNALLNTQKKEIEHQKELVEEKQKEMLDSILYAEQIQRALLANHALVNQTVPDSFVVFKPKDIVSGDFYWAARKGSRFYLAVCDSTGHGVPGAFMSLLNMTYLNEAINEKNIKEPNEVFDHVRKRLIENISQNGRQDGMDAILLCFEDGSDIVRYAAANNAPVLVSGKVLTELPADKMPIGKGEKQQAFSAHSFHVKPGDLIYLYTDGFADQFGGPKGKKFKYKQLEDLLLAGHHLPVLEQEEILIETFESWRGELDQIDDVCILGIRV